MAEDRTAPNGEAGAPAPPEQGNSQWAPILQDLGRRLLPVVVSTGSLLTFVAFAGSVIVWTRLNAVEVAPDQAITAFPRGELVSIGASLLLLYGFFGALAVLGAFLIDRGGRPTPGMAVGLLALVAVEGLGAIFLASGSPLEEAAAAAVLFVFPVAFALWVTRLGRFSQLKDELHVRAMEMRGPLPLETGLRPQHSRPASEQTRTGRTLSIALAALILAMIAIQVDASDGALLGLVGGLGVLYLLAVFKCLREDARLASSGRKADRESEEQETAELAEREEAWAKRWARSSDPNELRAWQEGEGRAIQDVRLARRRPYRLYLNRPGMALVAVALIAAAALPAWRLEEPWLGGALAAAGFIAMWLWRMAIFTRDKVMWFGLAVFLSVPLFGTFMAMARNLDDPQIQPVALIRSTDRPDEAIHGLYVTEAKERVYFASAATEGCTGSLRENSGRLLWVPRDEVVAMSIGPLQSVGDAAKSSLEMAFALTPAVETPAGDSVSLTPGEARSEEGDLGEEAPLTVQRLENVGPAVRPTFGRGLGLESENARPEDVVTLTMSTPIEDGFGTHRDGRSLRVGGTPAKIAINPVRDGERAEFVATEAGPPLLLDKGLGVYVETEGGEFVRDGDAPGDEGEDRFVKLVEDTRVASTGHSDEDGRLYLPIEEEDGADTVTDTTVELRDGTTAVLAPTLHRQAWNKDEIKFKVPEKAGTGAVTVDCEQLAGEPLLRVERPPEARISARMLNSGELYVDGRRSSDDGAVRALRWKASGRSHLRNAVQAGPGRKGTAAGAIPLPRRLGVHRVQLIVEDDQGEIDRATLILARLPDPHIVLATTEGDASASGDATHSKPLEPIALKRVRRSLLAALGEEVPTKAIVDAHAVDETGGKLAEKSVKAAIAAQERLLTADAATSAGLRGEGIGTRIRAFGENCVGATAGTSGERFVDLYVMVEGVRLGMPQACAPRRVVHRPWAEAGQDANAPGDKPVPTGRRSTS